jgi:signal transduction histidine kinase/CheY-like chemotaxis protein
MSLGTRPQDAPAGAYAHPIAFSIHLSRNLVVQGAGMVMVSLMGLAIVRWQAVLVWCLAALAIVSAENYCLRTIAADGPGARRAARWASVLRVLVTSVYAFAAFVLVAKGGPGERLFAFALMSASMVHVLMRYYRAPGIVAASLAPYMIVLALVGVNLVRTAFHAGHWLEAFAPVFTIAMFAVQFWSARAQLSGAWVELMSAREAAEHRERAAETANRAKSQFLSTMSHELRTPLNGVLGMAQALAGEELTRTQRERVSIIRRSSEALLSVLNDLLDLSKIEAGALDLEISQFDLEHLVRGVVAAYQPLAAKKGLSFEFDVDAAARGAYLGDSPRIRRVLYSLADNAVKFTEIGGVVLWASAENGQLVVRVADSGIGIDDADREHLFDGFFQADGTLTRRYGGAGVGLAVCRQLTGLMGGTIEAASKPGQGSTFTVRLPLQRVQAADQPAAETATEAPPRPEDLRVLAAEDNATNQLVLRALLAAVGIAPTLVENGREAIAAWETQDWDIVLMDIQMPEMDGVEATRAIRLRELETGRARTPIIAVTANAMTHQVDEYNAAGMDGVVPKPIDNLCLFEVIDQALSLGQAPDEARAVA